MWLVAHSPPLPLLQTAGSVRANHQATAKMSWQETPSKRRACDRRLLAQELPGSELSLGEGA